MSKVNRAICIRRTIGKDELRPAFGPGTQLLINLPFLPGLEHLRLTTRQIALHRKIRTGQIEGLLVINSHQKSLSLNL